MIKFNMEAKEALCKGVNILAEAVKCTLRPSSRNVLISNDGSPYITKDGVTVAKNVKLTDKFEQLGATVIKNVASKTCDQAGDGPQPLYSKILTPKGWTTMGELKVGDVICGTNSTSQEVIGIFPKGEKEIYEIHFGNGQTVECCEDHLWTITTYYGKTKTITVKEMFGNETFITESGKKLHKFYTPKTKVFFDEQNLPLDPFLVGLLLGDGSLTKNGSVELSLALDQDYILNEIILPENIKYTSVKDENKHYLRVKFSRIEPIGPTMHDYIKQIGLLNCNSFTKFIPKQYLYNSENNRLKLLKGLEETDGHLNKRGLLEYSTVSNQLKTDIIELMNGLGLYTYNYKLERKENSSYSNGYIYRIHQLKGFKYGTQITKIVKTGKHTEMQCIKVSNEDHLYITNDYIVTHNTTTSTVLAQAIINLGIELIKEGHNPILVKQGMYKALKSIKDSIKKQSVEITTTKQLKDIATISANNDEFIGGIIAEAMEAVNRKGIITVDPSESTDTYVEIVEGMQFSNGYLSPYFVNNKEKMNVSFENPNILILNKKLRNLSEIIEPLNASVRENTQVMIIVPDVESEVLNQLILNNMNGAIKACIVKAPGFGEYQEDHIKDITVLTSTEEPVGIYTIGKAEKVIVTRDTTTIINGKGSDINLSVHISQLYSQLEAEPYEMNQMKIRERLAKLQGGAAIIHVGALSEVEMLEKKDRIDDALSATRAAIEEGVVIGGGYALANCIEELTNVDFDNEDEKLGIDIIMKAINAPSQTILDNAGIELTSNIKCTVKNTNGYNVRTNKWEDFFESGIIDPAKVTRSAIENAISVASMFLTTECCIINEYEVLERTD